MAINIMSGTGLRHGLDQIEREYTRNLINYLDTGVFENKSNRTSMQAYTIVVNLADQDNCAEELYKYYINTITQYVTSKVAAEVGSLSGEFMLSALVHRWENHKILVHWLHKIFYYLDRYFVKNKTKDHDSKVHPLFQAGLNIFRERVIDVYHQKIKVAIIDQITKERDGQLIDRDRVKNAVLTFIQVGLTEVKIAKVASGTDQRLAYEGVSNYDFYNRYFETEFLEDSRLHYAAKTSGWISSLSCPEYVQAARKSIEDEENRADKYLDPKTKSLLLEKVQNEVIQRHAQTLVDLEGTGCTEMFKHDKRDELKQMFSIFKRIETTLDFITGKMGPYIESRGTVIVMDQQLQEDAVEYTKALLHLKGEIDSMVEYSFDNHPKFQRQRDQSFQNFMNKNKLSAPYIASYCDMEMRKGLKGISEQETEQRLDAIIRLFVCLHDRDVFIRNYTRYLSKRLLDGLSVSDEAEQKMIGKLKVECGHNIVNRISNMFQDIHISKTMMDEFRRGVDGGAPGGVALQVQVLRNGCWPDQNVEPCTIPQELLPCKNRFEGYYGGKHHGRNLTWLLGFGQCELTTTFAPKRYTLIVNPYQAAILLLFNRQPNLTINQIRETTKLTDKTIKAHLINFFNPKNRLMTKQSKGKNLEDTDEFSVSTDFTCSTLRVNFIPKKVKKDEGSEKVDDKAVEQERKNVVDCVIVRIAKSRRTIKHQELLTEVMRQVTHFKPQPTIIKEQIESLIQREYLKRDENDRTLYIYIP